jgi:hypothetical protein
MCGGRDVTVERKRERKREKGRGKRRERQKSWSKTWCVGNCTPLLPLRKELKRWSWRTDIADDCLLR